MAGKTRNPFSVNSRRFDPYKNFRFRVGIAPFVAAAAAGTAAFLLVRRLAGKRSDVKDSHDRFANTDLG